MDMEFVRNLFQMPKSSTSLSSRVVTDAPVSMWKLIGCLSSRLLDSGVALMNGAVDSDCPSKKPVILLV